MTSSSDVRANGIKKSIEQSFRWLNWLSITALVFAFGASISRHFSGADIEFIGVALPNMATPFIFAIMSIVHLFIVKHIVDECWDAWRHLSTHDRSEIYETISRSGGILTKGVSSYTDAMYVENGNFYLKTDISNASTWVHVALVILSFSAMVDFRWHVVTYVQFSVAFIIIRLNWSLAANALIALADLGRNSNASLYFHSGKKGIRPFSSISGFMIFDNQSTKDYTLMDIWESVLKMVLLGFLVAAVVGVSLLVAVVVSFVF
jgi:hypothetical protein